MPQLAGREQAAHGRGEDDLALLLARNPLLHDALGQRQRQEDVDLVVRADEVDRDLPDRAGLAHAGIVPQHVEVPRLRLRDVVGVGQVEPLDAEVAQAERLGLLAQRRDLRRDLRGGDDVVAVLGHADGGGLAEAGAGAGDEDGLGHGRFLSWLSRLMVEDEGSARRAQGGDAGLRDLDILRDGAAGDAHAPR